MPEALTLEAARNLFERRRDAWLASDAEAYMALWHDEMVIEIPNRREPIRGKAAYAALIEQSMQSMRPVSWDFHSIAVDGDRVLAEWTLAGEFLPSHSVVRWRGMSICRIENGLICEWREYWNPEALRSS